MAKHNGKAASLIRGALAVLAVCGVTRSAAAMPVASSPDATPAYVETIALKKLHHTACRRLSADRSFAGREIGEGYGTYKRDYVESPLGHFGPEISANGEVHFPYTLSR